MGNATKMDAVAAALRLKGARDACVHLILNPYTRAVGVGRLADALRSAGLKYADVVAEVKKIHTDYQKPEPTDADVDWWLEEAGMLESGS